MGFTPTFYAGRPKLSEVTIDSDLDMGGRKILHAQLGSPHMPETWPTEELDWGDTAPSEYSPEVGWSATSTNRSYTVFTNSGTGAKYRLKIRVDTGTYAVTSIIIEVDGVTVLNVGTVVNPGETYESPVFGVDTGQAVILTVTYGGTGSRMYLSYQSTGEWWGAKTFNLTGKWLALGIDMKGLAATVKVQGVEMPYSEYVKAFPLAPTELKIPGNWDPSQQRPVIKVYK